MTTTHHFYSIARARISRGDQHLVIVIEDLEQNESVIFCDVDHVEGVRQLAIAAIEALKLVDPTGPEAMAANCAHEVVSQITVTTCCDDGEGTRNAAS